MKPVPRHSTSLTTARLPGRPATIDAFPDIHTTYYCYGEIENMKRRANR